MYAPIFYIIAPRAYALASSGLQQLLGLAGYNNIKIIAPKKRKEDTKADYLFLMDECIKLPELEKFYQWKKLILL